MRQEKLNQKLQKELILKMELNEEVNRLETLVREELSGEGDKTADLPNLSKKVYHLLIGVLEKDYDFLGGLDEGGSNYVLQVWRKLD